MIDTQYIVNSNKCEYIHVYFENNPYLNLYILPTNLYWIIIMVLYRYSCYQVCHYGSIEHNAKTLYLLYYCVL